MARLYYGDARDKKKAEEPVIPGPGKTAWKGLLVQDDVLHIGISKAADGLYKISPRLSRKTLAYSSLFAGVATNVVLSQPKDLKELGWSLLGNTFCLLAGSMVISWKMDRDNDANKFKDGLIDRFLRIVRMPVLAVGVFEIAVAGLRFKFPEIDIYKKFMVLGDGIFCTAIGISCYLISSGTGAYNDFKKWSLGLSEKLDEMIFGKEQ